MRTGYTVGKFLKTKRIEAKLSQTELAKKLGYRSQFICNWENGKSNPPVRILTKAIKTLKISEREILEVLQKNSMQYWKGIIGSKNV